MKLSGEGIEGIGFAIPINSTTDVVNQLIEFKTVKRPYIGVTGQGIDSSITEIYGLPAGVSVKEVEEGSPADKAGLQKGDIITKIEGKEVSTVTELNKVKYTYKIGDTVTLTILRNGQEQEIELTLGEEPVQEGEDETEEKKKLLQKQIQKDNSNSGSRGSSSFPSSIWDLFR